MLSINRRREHAEKIFFEIRSLLSAHWSFLPRTSQDLFVDDALLFHQGRWCDSCVMYASTKEILCFRTDDDSIVKDVEGIPFWQDPLRRQTECKLTLVFFFFCLNNRWSLFPYSFFFWWVLTSSAHQKSTPFLCIPLICLSATQLLLIFFPSHSANIAASTYVSIIVDVCNGYKETSTEIVLRSASISSHGTTACTVAFGF